MRANPFESQLERLARTLTDQFGVKVICQGDNAWTDGRQIVLPSLPEPIDENLERMMVGYLDHEMAHVAFSDFNVAEQFAKKHPGFDGMLNVVEDALIERRAMQRWPGVRHNLDMMFQQIRGRVAQLIQQRGPFDRFCTAVYLKLAHHGDLMGLQGELAGYDDLLDRFAAVQTTHDAGDLAEQLLARWLKRNPPKPQPSSQSQRPAAEPPKAKSSGIAPGANSGSGQRPDDAAPAGSDPQDGEQASRDDAPAGDLSTAQPEADSEQPDADDASNAQQTGAPQRTRKRRRRPNTTTPAEEDDGRSAGGQIVAPNGGTLIGQALVEAIAESVAQLTNTTEYRVFTKKHDRIDTVAPAPDQAVQSMLASGSDVVRRLRRGLANALRSAEKRWWRDDQVRGSLSPRTMYRLCTDRRLLDVFRIRSTVQGRSTAVCVLLDASGSMTSRKMDVARQAMRVLLEALADLKIATEALTFTTGDRFSLAEACRTTGQDHSQLQTRFSRFGNLEIGVVKQFEESVKKAMSRLPSVRGSGLTPLGEAMQIGASRLITRPENRKIMVVLTDGKAGCESGDDAASQHAQRIAGRITKAGIELVGVGIQDESLKVIVADTIIIHELQDLPAQLCKLLGRTLQKGLSHVG